MHFVKQHVKYSEMFIPQRGPSIMGFAPASSDDGPGAAPDISKAVAFTIDGGSAFVVDKGVWHTTPFPLEEEAEFLLALPVKILEDIDVRKIDELTV